MDKIEKIRKLIAKAQGTTNAHEAAAFMMKATAMMEAEGVDMDTVDLSAIGEASVKSLFSVSKPKVYEATLMHAIASAFGCQLMWNKSRSEYRLFGEDNYAKIIFVGPKDRLGLATYAAEVLGPQLKKARSQFSNETATKIWALVLEGMSSYDAKYAREDNKAVVRKEVTKRADAFAAGWAYEIKTKVTAFATNDRETQLIETYVKNNSDEGAAEAKSGTLDAASFRAGIEAAKDANLHRPIEGSDQEQHLLGQTRQLTHGG